MLILNKIYNDDLIDSIRIKYDEAIENDDTSYAHGEYDGKVYSRHVREPHKKIPELKNLINNQIKEIAKGYYGGNFSIRHISMWRNHHIPGVIINKKELFSNYWHCDNRSTEYLKFFVLLKEVKKNDGPFNVMTQQRTRQLMKMGFGTREDFNLPDEVINDPQHVITITGPTGTAYFANTELCLHLAGNPTFGRFRDILVFVLGPSSKPLPEDWIDEFSPDKEYLKIKEK